MWGEELYGSYSPPTHTQVARQTDRHTSSKRSRRERDTPADRDKSCEVETLQITVGADGDTYNKAEHLVHRTHRSCNSRLIDVGRKRSVEVEGKSGHANSKNQRNAREQPHG